MKFLKRQETLPLPVIIFICFLASLVFNWRAVSSISVAILAISGLLTLTKQKEPKSSPFFYFSIACLLFFISKLAALSYTGNMNEGLAHVRKSLLLALAPFCFYAHRKSFRLYNSCILQALTLMTLTAFLYCLGAGGIRYFSEETFNEFFYHQFAGGLGHHAIQLSIIVFINLIWLHNNETSFSKIRENIISLLLLLFILLLSSKMVICFSCIWLLHLVLRKWQTRTPAVYFLSVAFMMVLLFAFTRNPLRSRFREVFTGDSQLFRQPTFHQGIYFNGLQFRLVQYRFTWELLEETKSWIGGLAPGDAQTKLDEKYISTGMYTGMDHQSGYLGYHTHNQFLQTLLQQGVTGLACFIFLWIQILRLLWIKKSFLGKLLCLLLLAWCFTDAVLETQYGIAIFLLIPLACWLSQNESLLETKAKVKPEVSGAGNLVYA